jgi:HEAT repeat protein
MPQADLSRALLLSIIALGGCMERHTHDPDWLQSHGTEFEKQMYIAEIGNSEDQANAPKIAPFLNDPTPKIVGSTLFYLGYLHARSYIPTLETFLTSGDETIVNMAGSGLRNMVDARDTSLLPKLYPVLSHRFLLARMSAIECIGAIGSNDSTQILLAKLPSEEPAAQLQIIDALGKIKDSRALPALEAQLVAVKAMDHSVPNKGGVRGSVPHPDLMQFILKRAIESIRGGI